MNIVCLDMEGVLVPEIWIAFAEASGIPELRRTTRDEPDYGKLMNFRLGILKEHGLGLKEIQATIAKIDPLPGAKEFLDELRAVTQVLILSDTFSQRILYPVISPLGATSRELQKIVGQLSFSIRGLANCSNVSLRISTWVMERSSSRNSFAPGRGSILAMVA